MTVPPNDLPALIQQLREQTSERRWFEFKENDGDPQKIGEYLSGLANTAALLERERGYLVWGVRDGIHEVVGTRFDPWVRKKGGEEMIPWLRRLLKPDLAFEFHRVDVEGHRLVVLEIPAAIGSPVSFSGRRWIRIESHLKPLEDFPEEEKRLFQALQRSSFETNLARCDLDRDQALDLLGWREW